jgi:hypothetical protein
MCRQRTGGVDCKDFARSSWNLVLMFVVTLRYMQRACPRSCVMLCASNMCDSYEITTPLTHLIRRMVRNEPVPYSVG